MSAKSCGTSGSVRSCGGSVRLGTASGHEVVLDALYERKRDKKSVRVLTVIIYVFCVSLAAIMLSLYYVFFWEPKDAQYAQRKVFLTVDQKTSTTPMPTCLMPHTGGGNSTVNGSIIYSATNTSDPTNINLAESLTDFSQYSTELPDTTLEGTINGTDNDIGTYSTTENNT